MKQIVDKKLFETGIICLQDLCLILAF